MTADTARYRAERLDAQLPDRSPTCPRCAELLPPGSKWCNECGTWVTLDGPRSSDLRSRREQQAARLGEDTQPTEGSVI